MATTTTRTVRAPRTVTRDEALENPEAVNQELAEVIEETIKIDLPVIAEPPEDLVNLPGGLTYKGAFFRTAEVRELTGRDEEILSRSAQSQNFNVILFMDKLLRCGVTRIGSIPEKETEALLSQLLIGDREMLILGIRKATYGSKIEISDWACSKCGSEAILDMDISDIPVVQLDDDIEFDVNLKDDSIAHVRLANGSDQSAMFEKQDLTYVQRETILLSKCIEYIRDKHGLENYMVARPSMALDLTMSDRHAILDELDKRQPGPKYNKIEYKCEACGEDSMVVVTIGHLFRHFRWF